MKEHFQKILGMENALDNENELLAYGYDASGLEGDAKIVLFPKNEEHIRKILTYANRTDTPVVPRGLGANPNGMAVPDGAIVVDMAKFDRVHTINLKEGWVLVDAGVVLSDLQRLLAEHDSAFPINPQSSNVSTIGALLAMNQMSRRSHKYGRLKDHVESIEIVDGTGKHFPDGNEGFIGLEGCGAIITKAKIRLLEEPETVTTDLRYYENTTDLLAAVEEYNDDLTVLSLEYLNPRLAAMLGLDEKHALLVEYEGEKGEYVNEEQQARLWNKRDGAWDAAAAAGHQYIEDCQCTPEQLYDVLEWCNDIDVPVASHIGMGIVHPFFDRQAPEDYYHLLESVGARAAGQFGYGLLKREYVGKDLKDRFLRLKEEYDYDDIINRGKVADYV